VIVDFEFVRSYVKLSVSPSNNKLFVAVCSERNVLREY